VWFTSLRKHGNLYHGFPHSQSVARTRMHRLSFFFFQTVALRQSRVIRHSKGGGKWGDEVYGLCIACRAGIARMKATTRLVSLIPLSVEGRVERRHPQDTARIRKFGLSLFILVGHRGSREKERDVCVYR
jgi:hypothetical protein